MARPAETLDHASVMPWWRIKVGIDATRTWPAEGVTCPWPNGTVMSPEVKAKIDAIWSRLGIET